MIHSSSSSVFFEQNNIGSNMRTPDPFNADSIPTPVRPPNALQPMGEVVTTVFTSANLMAEARQNILPGMYALNAPMIRFVI